MSSNFHIVSHNQRLREIVVLPPNMARIEFDYESMRVVRNINISYQLIGYKRIDCMQT